ncbi:serine/threonine-protein kinase [Streptomyces sp. NPDC001515]
MDETVESVGRGRYRLVRSVGRGGMAAVYQATDTALGREVAVKLMDRTATGEDFRRRFRREARAVAALNHRNVIAIHDIGEEPVGGGDPTPYLVMEFVHGRPLSDVVSTGPTAVHEALRITADILDGLAAGHEAGLVHRDIKPANVMVARDGTVKVLDFGIARGPAADTAPVTRAGTVVGTAAYMSPEQAQGRALDHRSDLYATGVLLFELLSGRSPFDAGAEAALLYHHVHTPPPHRPAGAVRQLVRERGQPSGFVDTRRGTSPAARPPRYVHRTLQPARTTTPAGVRHGVGIGTTRPSPPPP